MRICTALREAGVEVWFDQSELRGGDAWDSAIRRQIKSCALFIPVISRNTHARGEGYFRLEWKLAVDRSHLMARDQAFLIPVVVDDLPKSDDRVPEQFSAVQWTRLADEATTSAFVDRVKHLLSSPATSSDLAPASTVETHHSSRSRAIYAGIAVILLSLSALALYRWIVPARNQRQVEAVTPSNIPFNSVAVLPFTDVSQQKDQEYFSNGLSEQLINQLSRIPSLRVPARRSSFYFKNKSDDLATIARMLLVAHILEGNVRKEGANLRVTAELVRADTGYHVWSETYDFVLKDVFKVQDEIVGAVVTALKLRLGAMQPTAAQRTSNTEAYDQFLLARQYYAHGSLDDLKRATETLRKALVLDPNYSAAYSDLAVVTMALADLSSDTAKIQEASSYVDKAITLAPGYASGYSTRGWLRTNYLWNWAGAESDYRKALELDAGNADVFGNYGWLLQCLGKLPQAIELGRKGTALDPLSQPAWTNLAHGLTAAREFEEGRAAVAHALRLSPDNFLALDVLGTAQLLEGNAAEALHTFRQVRFEGMRLQGVAMAQYSLNHANESQEALDTLVAKFAHDGPFQIAEVFSWRGDKDKAFEWLRRAFEQKDSGVASMKTSLLLESIRGDARYVDLLKKMNLPL